MMLFNKNSFAIAYGRVKAYDLANTVTLDSEEKAIFLNEDVAKKMQALNSKGLLEHEPIVLAGLVENGAMVAEAMIIFNGKIVHPALVDGQGCPLVLVAGKITRNRKYEVNFKDEIPWSCRLRYAVHLKTGENVSTFFHTTFYNDAADNLYSQTAPGTFCVTIGREMADKASSLDQDGKRTINRYMNGMRLETVA